MPPRVSLFLQKHNLPFWLAVLFFFFLFLRDNVSACQCSGPGATTCQAIGPQSAVFLGVVDSIEDPSFFGFLKVVSLRSSISFRDQYWMYSDQVTVVFTVEEWFSGQPQKTARLHINKFLGACGYEYHPGDLFFHKGERYLVYAATTTAFSLPTIAARHAARMTKTTRKSKTSAACIACLPPS